jgi:hypothetical protein
MLEKKTIFREYFPGYLGHIPMKNEIIGMTVGATNEQIKSILNKQPPFEDQLIPSKLDDYTYYTKNYFCENFSKDYKLEEDKIYSNKSKDAKTWINGSKYRIYPQHVPGYTAHLPGKQSSNIFGMSYAKATAHAIKGDYCKKNDLPADERYKTINSLYFEKPKMRSDEDQEYLDQLKKEKANIINKPVQSSKEDNELPDKFKEILNDRELKKNSVDLPYIVGYKGFRRGVKSGNYYGKNFADTSISAKIDSIKK